MFVKIDGEHWVNMLLVTSVCREGDILKVMMNDGCIFLVREDCEPEVKKAMRDLETILKKIRMGWI